jgi:hypothetical protein
LKKKKAQEKFSIKGKIFAEISSARKGHGKVLRFGFFMIFSLNLSGVFGGEG